MGWTWSDGERDLSTAVVLRVREAQPSLKMTGVGMRKSCFSLSRESCIHIGFGKLWIGVHVKLNRQTAGLEQITSGAKDGANLDTLIAALKRCATPRHSFVTLCLSFVLAFLLTDFAASAQDQDKDADKTAVPAPAAKKDQKKDQKKDGKKEAPAEEKKGGMTADTFSGLAFRSIGPAVASGRVM